MLTFKKFGNQGLKTLKNNFQLNLKVHNNFSTLNNLEVIQSKIDRQSQEFQVK